MKRIIVYTLLCLVLPTVVNAQLSWEDVIASSDYVWGQGSGTDLKQADDEAKKDLASLITVNVNSTTETTLHNVQTNDEATSNIETSQTIQISSSVSLSNCKRIVREEDGYFHVLRYVEESEVNRMFDVRKQKIRDLIDYGEKAESACKIGDALRNFYWALKLIHSIPETRRTDLIASDGHSLDSYLSKRIENILDDCRIEAACRLPIADDEAHHAVQLNFTYKGRPIVALDYKFYDGQDWNSEALKDGVAEVEVPADFTKLTVRLDYEAQHQWKQDPMIEDLLTSQSKKLPFRQNQKSVTLTALQEAAPVQVAAASKLAKTMAVDTLSENFNKRDINQQANIVAPIIRAIESRSYDDVKPLCTENGWKWFEKLVKYGKAKIINRDNLEVAKFANGYLIRGVKAKFSFKRNKSFVEDLVFYVKDNKVDGINFGLDESALADIYRHGNWNPRSRQILVNFLENYKSAYALENLEYLDAVFADDAIIIIGNKISGRQKSEVAPNNQVEFEKCQYTKNEYLDRLKKVFDKQEYVNLQFEDASVKKATRDNSSEIYQILIKQNYYSATYADQGYLFLLADITDPERPIIHVRVWDENKNDLMKYAEWNFGNGTH